MREPYSPRPEMLWKPDPAVEEARRQPGWPAFHRACGQHGLFFDHVERDGKRAPYKATAFTVERRRDYFVNLRVADGIGKTPIEALADAYRKAGQPVAETELDCLMGAVEGIDFEELLG